ncbi:MAG: hypothetical protein ACK5AZ_25580 [Bryobacteraceae bacterium]
MSSISYSGGTIIDTSFTGDTRGAIATGLINALVSAGWTSISGSGTDQVLRSASTPAGHNISMRVYDPGTGNCARVAMRNAAGTQVSHDYFLLPGASKTFYVIACRYNFFIFTPGTSAAREFVCGGTLAVPTFIETYLTVADLGWIQGKAINDTTTTVAGSFRTRLSSNAAHSTGLANATLSNVTNATSPSGMQQLIARMAASNNSGFDSGSRWADDTLRVIEAEIAWGTAMGSEGKSYGFIHNCMIVTGTYAADDRTITSFDGHAWHAITGSNTADRKGTLFFAIT